MRSVVLFVVALAWGCGPSEQPDGPGDQIRLSVQSEEVLGGTEVTLILTNRSPDPVGHNLCTSELERRAGAGWEPVPSNRVCTMELRMLAPGDEARYTIELPADLPPGDYRFRANVDRGDAGTRSRLSTEPFRVRG